MPGTLVIDLIGVPRAFYFQSADPAVANPDHLRTGIHWIDTTSSPYVWKRRNAANDGWDTLGKIRTDAEFNADVDARIKLLQKWALNFTDDGDAYIPAYEAMTVDIGVAAIGTGTLAYEKSTTADPDTFSSTTLPATLEAGAWLKVSVSSITGFVAVELKRTA